MDGADITLNRVGSSSLLVSAKLLMRRLPLKDALRNGTYDDSRFGICNCKNR